VRMAIEEISQPVVDMVRTPEYRVDPVFVVMLNVVLCQML